MGGTTQSGTLTCGPLFHHLLFPHLCWPTPHAYSSKIQKITYSYWAGCHHYHALRSRNKLVFRDWAYLHDIGGYSCIACRGLLSILGRTAHSCRVIADLPEH